MQVIGAQADSVIVCRVYASSPLRDRVASAFRERFGRRAEVIARAPGRVNLLGAHVDYNEGWVLPGAIDRAVWLAASRAEGRAGAIVALDRQAEVELDPLDLPPPVPERGADADWPDYPRGMAWALAEREIEVPPLDAVYASDVPEGAGVSSSAAVEMAFLLAWGRLGDFSLGAEDGARIGQRCENGYVGVGSGVMDQFASLAGRAGRLVLLDCRDLSHRLIPFPEGSGVLVADSGVRRRLAGSGFDDRRAECRRALEILREVDPRLRALRDVPAESLEEAAERLPSPLDRRVRHVVEECARVLRGVAVLETGDVQAFGRLVRASHESSRDLYEVTVPEVDLLAEAAWSAPGCFGARLLGGGFGGSVGALVDLEARDSVARSMRERFRAEHGRTPEIFTAEISDGAEVLPV